MRGSRWALGERAEQVQAGAQQNSRGGALGRLPGMPCLPPAGPPSVPVGGHQYTSLGRLRNTKKGLEHWLLHFFLFFIFYLLNTRVKVVKNSKFFKTQMRCNYYTQFLKSLKTVPWTGLFPFTKLQPLLIITGPLPALPGHTIQELCAPPQTPPGMSTSTAFRSQEVRLLHWF